MIDIPDVESEFFLPVNGVAAVDLGPACQAWANLVAPRLLRGVKREILHQQRARADQAHFALEDVPQFGQFI